MRIIEIKAQENGSHRNQTGTFSIIPKGFAVIPDDMEIPNFPFGEVEVEEINGVMTVTKWIKGEFPTIEIPPEDFSAEEKLNALIGGMTYE